MCNIYLIPILFIKLYELYMNLSIKSYNISPSFKTEYTHGAINFSFFITFYVNFLKLIFYFIIFNLYCIFKWKLRKDTRYTKLYLRYILLRV